MTQTETLSMASSTSRDLPWQPIFTIERSGRKEVTVYGIVALVEGLANAEQSISAVRPITVLGDTSYQLWSRSLLKPWQLIQHLHILKNNYPALTDEHLALFMASHSAEPRHIEMLEEIIAITGAAEDKLKCPPAAPLSSETRDSIGDGEKARRRYHNCSGKHISYLSAIKAEGNNPDNYLLESEVHHVRLRKILAELVQRPLDSLLSTTDGCQLPNYALSVYEMAYLYQSLLSPRPVSFVDEQIQPCAASYSQLGQLMHQYPRAISGGGRVDYRLISQDLFGPTAAPVVAKEGADGLLGVGIGPCERYANGLGLCIKLSSGFDNRHMELIVKEVLKKLQLIGPRKEMRKIPREVKTDHIKTHFHFKVV